MIANVVTDESITRPVDPKNGSGPLWAFGSRTIVRNENCVYAVIPETGQDVKPLCNTRWTLWRRPDGGRWEQVSAGAGFNEREPCLLARLPDGQLLISTNPAQTVTGANPKGSSWKCMPQLVRISPGPPAKLLQTITPHWNKPYPFSEHSYRGMAADAKSGRIFITNQIAISPNNFVWMLLDKNGSALSQGELLFPMRGCYQQIAVNGNAVFIMAVSDEIEPNQEWSEFKEKLLGPGWWKYVFRNIYFTMTPDALNESFGPVSTIASCDSTAGMMRNLDLSVDAKGDAHILFLERNIDVYAMRDRFFPNQPFTHALRYLVVRNGRVVSRQTLTEVTEDMSAPRPKPPNKEPVWLGAAKFKPGWATFHTAADQSLYVLYMLESGSEQQLWIRKIYPADSAPPQQIKLQQRMTQFNAVSTRNGCMPCNIIDLYGCTGTGDIRYVQIRLEPR